MPFASLAGALIVVFLIAGIQWLILNFTIGWDTKGLYLLYIHPVTNSCVFGYTLIRIAFYIAPRRKVATALVFTIILAALSILFLDAGWDDLHAMHSPQVRIVTYLQLIAILLCAGLAVLQVNYGVKKLGTPKKG